MSPDWDSDPAPISMRRMPTHRALTCSYVLNDPLSKADRGGLFSTL